VDVVDSSRWYPTLVRSDQQFNEEKALIIDTLSRLQPAGLAHFILSKDIFSFTMLPLQSNEPPLNDNNRAL
jgi:hypothetical protein